MRKNLKGPASILLLFIGLSQLFNACDSSPVPFTQKKESSDADTTVQANRALARTYYHLIQAGDLITRSDDDFESLSLQNFSKRDRTYSHSGMVFRENDSLVVYHSMAGAENPAGTMRRDPIDSFVDPAKKTGFGIFRYNLQAEEETRLHGIFQQHYANGLPFDKGFDLANSDSMYCSEVIAKSLREATGGRVEIPMSVLENFRPKIARFRSRHTFFKRFVYIGIDDLYLNAFCTEIKRIQYH